MNGHDLQKHIGLTARHVSYWTEQGWIRPTNVAPGSGRPLDFPHSEVIVATVMLKLVQAGFSSAMAHAMARNPAEAIGELQELIKALGEMP